jgi:hypothetical protein
VDYQLRKLGHQYIQGELSVDALAKKFFKAGASYLDLIPVIGELSTYQYGLRWSDMNQQDLENFHEFIRLVDRSINEWFSVTKTYIDLGNPPYEEISSMYPYTFTWDVDASNRACDSIQIQLHFSKDYGFEFESGQQRIVVDGDYQWAPVMAGPWWISFWVIFDDEMAELGDPNSFIEDTYPLNWDTSYSELSELLESRYDEID